MGGRRAALMAGAAVAAMAIGASAAPVYAADQAPEMGLASALGPSGFCRNMSLAAFMTAMSLPSRMIRKMVLAPISSRISRPNPIGETTECSSGFTATTTTISSRRMRTSIAADVLGEVRGFVDIMHDLVLNGGVACNMPSWRPAM